MMEIFEQGGQSFDGQEESKETAQEKRRDRAQNRSMEKKRQEEKIKVCAVFLSV